MVAAGKRLAPFFIRLSHRYKAYLIRMRQGIRAVGIAPALAGADQDGLDGN